MWAMGNWYLCISYWNWSVFFIKKFQLLWLITPRKIVEIDGFLHLVFQYVAKSIEGRLNICVAYIVYSQFLLKSS
jgi:hypothetical protein